MKYLALAVVIAALAIPLHQGLAAQSVEQVPVYTMVDGLITIGDTEWGPYELFGTPRFSVDGRRWGFAGIATGKDKGGESRVVDVIIQGKKVASFPAEFDWGDFTMSDDGSSWALSTTRGEETTLRVDSKSYGPYRHLKFNPEFSPDGKHWIFAAELDPESYVIVADGKQYGPFKGFDFLRPAGSKSPWFASVMKASGAGAFLVNGKEYGPYGWIGQVFVSSDGEVWGFETEKKIGRSSFRVVVVNGVEYPGAEALRLVAGATGEFFTWLTFSEEGDRAFLNTLRVGK
ncbi:MAG: hypothetical protein JXA15_01285 [Spirochaetales bacterium]|nr:hypothetical protein [Spirochaetales bacterium]